jgi:hypothetical protein
MPIILTPNVVVTIDPPPTPTIQVSPPDPPSVTVVPVVGPPGPQGPPGTGVNASFLHNQLAADDQWTVTHNLGFTPAGVLVKDSVGAIIEPADVQHLDANSMLINVGIITSGTALVS